MERYRINSWDQFLDDFQRHWPTDKDDVTAESLRKGNKRTGRHTEFRLTEKWTASAQSVFKLDGAGTVGKSTHGGIPWLRLMRRNAGPMAGYAPAGAREIKKMGKEFDRLHYAELLKAQRLDDAIAYVDRFLKHDPENPTLKRRAALARGGKGEDILMTCDRAGTRPSPEQIDTMCNLFKEAIALDPYLADPYWDLAVIHARFLDQPDQAAGYLADAKRLGYKHAMMKQLEAMIRPAG